MIALRYIVFAFAVLAVCLSTGTAQTQISRSVIASGAVNATGGNYRVQGTIGQPVIGPVKETQYAAFQGFWYREGNTAVNIERLRGVQPAGFELSVYPNPARQNAAVTLHAHAAGSVRFMLSDLIGRTRAVWTEDIHAAGAYRATLPLDGLPGGLYVLEARLGATAATSQLVIAR